MVLRNINRRRIANFITRKVDRLSFKYGRLYVLEMPLGLRSAGRNNHGYKVETVSALDDLITLVERREPWFKEVAVRRFVKGDVCFVARDNVQTIACLFATFNNVDLPIITDAPYILPLDPETIGIIDAYTLPEYRGKHAYSAVFEACMSHFAETKFKRVFGFIAPDNIRSLKVHQKLGLDKIVLLITSLGLLGVRRHFIKSMNKRIEEVL